MGTARPRITKADPELLAHGYHNSYEDRLAAAKRGRAALATAGQRPNNYPKVEPTGGRQFQCQ